MGSSGAIVRANVASGRIAALDGGCAGAGPSCGLSGWNTVSGAVISATPETRNRCGRAPGRGVIVTVSPDLRLEGGGELLVEHDLSGREAALEIAVDVETVLVSGRDREERSAPGGRDAGGAGVADARERRGRGGQGMTDAALLSHAGTPRACACG